MPGYRSLSEKYVGPGASLARIAEEHRRNGDFNAAATALEEALFAVMAESAVMLPWVCGRLASLYRSLGRLEDEERLLERYRESQITEEGRSRLSARLTKVQAMLGRRRHRDSGAHQSVAKVLQRSKARAHRETPVSNPQPPDDSGRRTGGRHPGERHSAG